MMLCVQKHSMISNALCYNLMKCFCQKYLLEMLKYPYLKQANMGWYTPSGGRS